MSHINYPTGSELFSTEDRRHRRSDQSMTPKRRLNDTLFNKIRWPMFIYLWFALGIGLFIYFLILIFA